MNDLGIFLVGAVVTLIWGSMVGAMLYAGITGGPKTKRDPGNKSDNGDELKDTDKNLQVVDNLR
jgi:hypothetical protein